MIGDPSDPGYRRGNQREMIANYKGVAFAAFAPRQVIMRMLECTEVEAIQFQCRAVADFAVMMAGRGRA